MSLISLTIVIIVMLIIAGILVVSVYETNGAVEINAFGSEILNIQNAVDEYYYRYDKYPVGNEYLINVSDISSGSIIQFSEETVADNKMAFKTVNLSLVGINDTYFGKGNGNDVYVLSEKTGKVYYIQGINFEGTVYYTLTQELQSILNIKVNNMILSDEIKIQDIIFVPSEIEYTNRPVTVQVKIPMGVIVDSVVATEDKSVSTEVIRGNTKIISINETSDNKNGNYTITVNYKDEGVSKTASYDVTNFDNIKPTITTIETINTNYKTVGISVNDDKSGIAFVKYDDKEIQDKEYFNNYGKTVTNFKFSIEIDSAYTIYVEDKAGNSITYVKNGVTTVPAKWRENVTSIYNGVPIPKGFAVSPYFGENVKNEGLVIYELNKGETQIPKTETQKQSMTERNQYVWIPVDNYMEFKRRDILNDTISYYYGTDNWEVAVNTDNVPYPTIEQHNSAYISEATLLEVQAMYASVKEYGGFYISRYEAGIDSKRNSPNEQLIIGNSVHFKMNKIPYNNISWSSSNTMNIDTGAAVQVARGIYPSNSRHNITGVVSTLTYGVQWDWLLKWCEGLNPSFNLTESAAHGNYSNTIIYSADELNSGALVWNVDSSTQYVSKDTTTLYPKTYGKKWALTTGALKVSKMQNIYDIAGNISEWTMEGNSTANRNVVGGSFNDDSFNYPVSIRDAQSQSYSSMFVGFRTTLYIKQ